MTDDARARTTALVTGASSGIGWELAHVFARAGHDVLVTARRGERLRALCTELEAAHGISALAIPVDLALPQGPDQLVDLISQTGRPVDYLANSAGFGQVGAFARLELPRQLQMMDVNMRALVHLTGLLLPGMLARRRGAILNVGSTSAFLPGPGMAIYFASKSFVLSFTQGLAYELRGTGVTATVVCPGPTDTEFAATAGSDRLALYQGGRLATAAEVADHAYRAMMQGQALSLHGKRTGLRVNLLKLAPLSVATRFGARATRPAT